MFRELKREAYEANPASPRHGLINLTFGSVARMALTSLQLAPRLEPIEPEPLKKHFKRKHGAGAYYGQASACASGRGGPAGRHPGTRAPGGSKRKPVRAQKASDFSRTGIPKCPKRCLKKKPT